MSAVQTTRSSLDAPGQLGSIVRNLQEELIACQRLALLGNMAAMIAHEYNNLLTPVTARAEAALMNLGDPEFVRQSLERILLQARRATAVSERLLHLAQGDDQPARVCSVPVAVRTALDSITRPLEKDGITVQISVPADLRVAAREELFAQVLLNLVLNARRAMQGQRGALSITARAVGDAAQIEVRDTGCGISPERLDGVFNPFLAADPYEHPNNWQRVGLGLSVCRMITFHHGARLQGLANDDRGCTFQLLWPLALADHDADIGSC